MAALLTWLVGYPLLITLMEALGLPRGLSLEHFAEFARRPDEWQALWRSLWISAASVALAGAVGIPLAFVFARTEFPGRRILGALVALPVALPPLVGVIAFLFLYGESGFVSRGLQSLLGLTEAPWRLSGPGAILLVHAYSMYVYFYLFTRAGLARLDVAMLEASASLGAGRVATLFRVTLPLLLPCTGRRLAADLHDLTGLLFRSLYLWRRFPGDDDPDRGVEAERRAVDGSGRDRDPGDCRLSGAVGDAAYRSGSLGGGRRHPWSGAVAPGADDGPGQGRRRGTLGWGLALLLLLPHLTLSAHLLCSAWDVDRRGPATGPRQQQLRVSDLHPGAAATGGQLGLDGDRGDGGRHAPGAGGRTPRSVKLRGRLGGVLETLLSIPWAVPGTVFAISLATAFSCARSRRLAAWCWWEHRGFCPLPSWCAACR